MKKLILSALAVLMGLPAGAQLKYFDGTLDQALQLAAKEGKHVMIMASTTWCLPCKRICQNVFTTPEAGDYFNPKFVFMKFEVDVHDPERIQERFNPVGYPTFIILDEKGDMYSEVAVVINSFEGMKGQFDEAMKNPLSQVIAAYESDPAKNANAYVDILFTKRKNEQAMEVMERAFDLRGIRENFTGENLALYTRYVKNFDSRIGRYMLDNRDGIIAAISDLRYNQLIENILQEMITGALRASDPEKADAEVACIMELCGTYPFLGGEYVAFIIANQKPEGEADAKALIGAARTSLEAFRGASENDRMMLVRFLARAARDEASKTELKAFVGELACSDRETAQMNRIVTPRVLQSVAMPDDMRRQM